MTSQTIPHVGVVCPNRRPTALERVTMGCAWTDFPAVDLLCDYNDKIQGRYDVLSTRVKQYYGQTLSVFLEGKSLLRNEPESLKALEGYAVPFLEELIRSIWQADGNWEEFDWLDVPHDVLLQWRAHDTENSPTQALGTSASEESLAENTVTDNQAARENLPNMSTRLNQTPEMSLDEEDLQTSDTATKKPTAGENFRKMSASGYNDQDDTNNEVVEKEDATNDGADQGAAVSERKDEDEGEEHSGYDSPDSTTGALAIVAPDMATPAAATTALATPDIVPVTPNPAPMAPNAMAPNTLAPVPVAAHQAVIPQAVIPQAVAPQAVAPQGAVPQAVIPQTVIPQAIIAVAPAPVPMPLVHMAVDHFQALDTHHIIPKPDNMYSRFE